MFQLFGDIFAGLFERTTAIAAIAAGVAGREYLLPALEVVRQRCAIAGASGRGGLLRVAFGRCLLRLGGRFNPGVFLQTERELSTAS